jgi:large repetitive protein
MKQVKFDDLARAAAEAGDHRTSRRSLLRLLGFGGAASLAASVAPDWLGDASAAIQDATPAPQTPVQPPIDVITVAQKASELFYDVDAIFEYVANEVHYEAYSGALRGEKGTLWSMAGNSVDQSLLLAALLKEALFDVRFAIGSLDDATSLQLADSMAIELDVLREQDLRAQLANLAVDGASVLDPLSSTGTTPVLTPEQQAEMDKATAAKDAQVAEAEKQLSASVKLITDALASKNISLPDPSAPALPDRERQQHVWVQYASGSEWIDLDPSVPNAGAGKAYATVEQTVAELPAELDHIVRFRLVKEYIGGGAAQRQDVMTFEQNARDLVGTPITLTHVPPSAFEALGQSIAGLIEGTLNYVPTLFAGEEVVTGQPIQFGTGGSPLGDDFLNEETDGETAGEGDTLAEWLVTDIVTPDGAIEPIERVIFDRVGFEQRAAAEASGTPIDVTTIPAVELVNLPDEGAVFPPMTAILGLAVVSSQVPSWYLDPARVNVDDLTNISLSLHGYHMTRDRLSIESLAPKGYRYFNSAPNVTSFVFRPDSVVEGQEPSLTIEADLIHRNASVVPVSGIAAEVNAEVLAGVMAHVVERVSLETTNWASDYQTERPDQSPAAVSVGRVFEEAEKQQVAITVLQPSSAEADSLAVSEQARARIKQALGAGFVVIVPESSVTIDGTPVSGWWQVDPATGSTLDRMENGRGSVLLGSVIFLQTGEEVGLLASILRVVRAYQKLGMCISAIVLAVSGILWTISAIQAGISAPGGLANLGAAGGAALGGTGAALFTCAAA